MQKDARCTPGFCMILRTKTELQLGPPARCPFLKPFFGEGSPKIDDRKKERSNLKLEDLVKRTRSIDVDRQRGGDWGPGNVWFTPGR